MKQVERSINIWP